MESFRRTRKFLETPLFSRNLKVKLVTLVEKGDLKAPFSTATTRRCREGRYSIPWIAPFYPWSLPYSAEGLARQHQVSFFESGMTRPGIEPRSPRPLAKTNKFLGSLLVRYSGPFLKSLSLYIYIYISNCSHLSISFILCSLSSYWT